MCEIFHFGAAVEEKIHGLFSGCERYIYRHHHHHHHIIIIFICTQNRIFFACSSKESCAKLDQNTLRNYLTIKLEIQTPIRRVTMTHGVLRKSFP